MICQRKEEATIICKPPSRGRAKLGIVVPYTNTNLEPDMQMLRPDGVSLHFARAAGYDIDEVPDSEQMHQFSLSSLDEVIDSLAATLPDAIIYGCTSATLAHGPKFDTDFAQTIAARRTCVIRRFCASREIGRLLVFNLPIS